MYTSRSQQRQSLRQSYALGIVPDPARGPLPEWDSGASAPVPAAEPQQLPHPLADFAESRRLHEYEASVRGRFESLLSRSGVDYARALFDTVLDLDRSARHAPVDPPADADCLLECGFHQVDVSPCADGRLLGLVEFMLRMPPQWVHRSSFAGALFDIEGSLRDWVSVEHNRYRAGEPNTADEPTQYLKVAVYHTSSSAPEKEGCAAHGSDVQQAAQAAYQRLEDFSQAIENSFCCGASIAQLLLGVDTDTDTLLVHVPGADGRPRLDDPIDNHVLYHDTEHGSAEEARAALEEAVTQAAGVAPENMSGIHRLILKLMENNIRHHAYVHAYHMGRYSTVGHDERFIAVGDAVPGPQLRNLAYYANVQTVEESAGDLDVGIKVMKRLNLERGLPIPLVINLHYRGNVPGARERTVCRAARLRNAIESRYADLVDQKYLFVLCGLTDISGDEPLDVVCNTAEDAV